MIARPAASVLGMSWKSPDLTMFTTSSLIAPANVIGSKHRSSPKQSRRYCQYNANRSAVRGTLFSSHCKNNSFRSLLTSSGHLVVAMKYAAVDCAGRTIMCWSNAVRREQSSIDSEAGGEDPEPTAFSPPYTFIPPAPPPRPRPENPFVKA